MARQLRSSARLQTLGSLLEAEPPLDPPTTYNPTPPAKKPRSRKAITKDPVPSPSSKTPETQNLDPTDPPSILFDDRLAFSTYITSNTTSPGIWLLLCKKSSPVRTIDYDAALLVALCNGWIDGQRKSLPLSTHPHHFLQRFTPRRKGSLWSARNVGIVEKLIAEGKMLEAGMLEVQKAKEDGRWDKAYKGSKDIETPPEFLERIEKAGGKRALNFWEGLKRPKRYAFLWRLETAKREETKQKRMDEFAALLAEGRSL